MPIEVRVVPPERLDLAGTDIVAGWLRARPSAAFLTALGTSALGVYAGLAALRSSGRLDISGVRLVQLDEYVGVPDRDRCSLYGWLLRDVVGALGFEPGQVLRLTGDAADPAAEAARHDEAILSAGGIDVSVLGLGPNGHLGFNEPPSGADAPTRVVDLAEASLESNARYWGSRDAVPRLAITVGMDRLVEARRTLLVVRGASKRAVLRRLVTEPVNDQLPASHLRGAAGVTLLTDTDAWPNDLPVPSRPAA
jgi:glucosamine-6-phosphate deaminase